MNHPCFMAVWLLCILLCMTSGEELNTERERSHVKLKEPYWYSYMNPRHALSDRAIKSAVMKEILKRLGMKHRPLPIPLDKRKHNIPRPVYDGGIGSASQINERAKQIQVVIAAEEGNDKEWRDEKQGFRFKLNHALLSNHIINYATLHVYNEADVDGSNGLLKTIHLKESAHENPRRKKKSNRKVHQKIVKTGGSSDVEDSIIKRSGESGHLIFHGKKFLNDPDFYHNDKTGDGVLKRGKHGKEAYPGIAMNATENGKGVFGFIRSRKISGSLENSKIKVKRHDSVKSKSDKKSDDEDSTKMSKDILTGKNTESDKNILSTHVFLQTKEWFEIHLKDIVEKWTDQYRGKTHTHTLKIECDNCGAKLRICKKPKYRPFLVLQLTEKKPRRQKRSYAVNCAPGYEKCCRQKLYINFKEISWHDWIIEPSGFEVNYCEGRCTGAGVISARSHAFVKQKLTSSHSYLNICCVPVKFSSLTLLHFDNHGLIHKTVLKNMTVEECGCV